MNEFAKTGAMAGVAVVLTLLAVTMKPGEARLSLFDDQGEAFFPGFTDGAAIAELETRWAHLPCLRLPPCQPQMAPRPSCSFCPLALLCLSANSPSCSSSIAPPIHAAASFSPSLTPPQTHPTAPPLRTVSGRRNAS